MLVIGIAIVDDDDEDEDDDADDEADDDDDNDEKESPAGTAGNVSVLAADVSREAAGRFEVTDAEVVA